MMTPQKRRWLAGALGTGLVLLLVVLASLDTLGEYDALERFELTEVTAYEPPRPPPPPPSRPSDSRAGGSAGLLLPRESSAAVTLDRMQLDVQFTVAEVGKVNIAGLGQGVGVGSGDGAGDGSGSGFSLVTLSELDQQPTVLSAPVFVWPQAAAERGMTEFELLFHILIDEEGRTYPIAIPQNPFPFLTPEFMEYASKVRFSPPTRLGIPVRTEYTWSVKIKR